MRGHLAAYASALVVPLLLFNAFVIHTYTASERARNEERALELARTIAADLDRMIGAHIVTLQALASLPSLDNADFAAFHTQASRILAGSGLHVFLRDLENRQLVNTGVSFGTPLPLITESEVHRRAIETKQPAVARPFRGARAQPSPVVVTLPVPREGGEVKYTLSMSLPADGIPKAVRQERLPAGWIAAVSDRDNVLVALSAHQERFVGEPLPGGGVEPSASQEGVTERAGLDGRPALQGYRWMEMSGWRVAVFAPMAVIEAPLRRIWELFALSGSVLVALSVMGAIALGRWLALPVRMLAHTATTIARGKTPAQLSTPLREVNEVGAFLAESTIKRQRAEEALREANERTTLALEAGQMGTFTVDLSSGRVAWSPEVFRMSGLSSNGFAGTLEAVEQLIHPDDREPMRARRAAALETPGPYENAFRIRRPDGEERWLELRGKIRRSPGGAPLSIFGVVWDVTERKVIEAEHDRLVSIIEESPDIIKSATPDGRVLYLNAAGRRKLGIGATEVIRHLHMKDIRTPEAWRKTLEVQLPMAARYGSWSGESVLLARDGREVPVSQVIVAHKDAHGDVAYYSTMCRDITQQQRAAERQLLLVRELNHRTNNLLAVIRSIVSSTFVDDRPVDEARDVLLERLQALGRVHALLGQTQWNGASLQNLIDEELAAIIGRGRIEGPPVTLTAEATQTFALVLHELATNAAKYGALSVPKGEVVVSWGIRGEGDQACLRFLWRERGGPPVAPPQREGFGRMLLVDVAALDFATRPRLAFDKEGLRYEFEAPLARVAEPKSPAGATAPLANG